MHAYANATTVTRHEDEIPLMMRAVNGEHILINDFYLLCLTQHHKRNISLVMPPCIIANSSRFHHFITAAIDRHKTIYGVKTMVIVSTAGRLTILSTQLTHPVDTPC